MNEGPASGALPDGWRRLRVADVLKLRNGRAFKSGEWVTTGRPIIRIQNLKSGEASFNYFDGELPEQFAARRGDLLFAWSGTPGTSFGAHIWDGPDAWVNQHIFRVDYSSEELDGPFLKFALDANLASYIDQAQGGVGLAHITKSKLNASCLLVPPLDEQRRISARLCEIYTRQEVIAGHLDLARTVLVRLRAAILADACAGRLSKDVRAGDTDGDAVDAPVSWRRTTLGELADSIRGGSSEVPSQKATEHPVLRSSSVRSLCIDYEDVRYLSSEQSQKAANFVQDGDLLVTRLNGNIEYVGNAAVVDGLGDRRLQYPDRLFRLRLKEPAHAQYLQLFFASPRVRAQVRAASRSAAGHQRISISDLKGFSIELPPLDEQHEIVLRANAMLATAARMTDQVARTAAALDRVSDASLAKAFRGELVPTEAALAEEDGGDYEPTELLLARAGSPRGAA